MADLIMGLGALVLGILLIVAGIKGMKSQKTVKVTLSNKYWAVCDGCGEHFRIFTMPAKKAKYCPECGRMIKWND